MTRTPFTEESRRWASLCIAFVAAFGAVATSDAHFVVSRRSLRELIADSDVVVHARVLQEEHIEAIEGNEGQRRRPPSVRILGVIKGPANKGERLSFAQHGHGSAVLERGQEVLLCLRNIARSSELAPLADKMGVRWYSGQEHDDEWALTRDSRKPVLEAARRYAAIEEMLPSERDMALRKITTRLLASRHARLARSALQDLIDLPESPLLGPADLPGLESIVRNGDREIDIRLGLLVEIERRGLVHGEADWVHLLQTTRGPDRLAVIPVAGRRRSSDVQAELVKILEGPEPGAATAAAVALGSPGNAAAVCPLQKALGSGDSRLAIAAIRGLGRIGTPAARDVIEQAAATHPDREVRRRAQAEARLIESRAQGR